MHHESPEENDAALRAADIAQERLLQVSQHLPSRTDLEAIESAIERAENSLRAASLTAALRAEDASHITARLDLVIAALHELNITAVFLQELAEKLRDDTTRIVNAVERFDDNDL